MVIAQKIASYNTYCIYETHCTWSEINRSGAKLGIREEFEGAILSVIDPQLIFSSMNPISRCVDTFSKT